MTANHPIYSTTHGAWRPAGELLPGERLLSLHGETALASKAKLPGTHTVYNLEVRVLHNFLVGSVGVVVHNSCAGFWNKVLRYAGNIYELPIDHIWRGHSFVNKVPGKSYFGQHMTKTKIKDLVNEMLKDPNVVWQDVGGQLRALVDGSNYPGFVNNGIIGHDVNGSILNTIRVSVAMDGPDIVIKNAFPSSTIQ